jgi:hypothetical protein
MRTNQLNASEIFCPVSRTWFMRNISNALQWECRCSQPESGRLISVVTSVKDREIEFVEMLHSLTKVDTPNRFVIEHVVHDFRMNLSRKHYIENMAVFHTTYDSSSDSGLFDGFNRGLRLTSGGFISFLNSDDLYSPNFLKQAVLTLETSRADWVFGDVQMFGDSNLKYRGKPLYFRNSWRRFSMFHHPTVLVRRDLFEKVGDFQTKYNRAQIRYASDYLWFLTAQSMGAVGVYNSRICNYMRTGGASAENPSRILNEGKKMAWRVYPQKFLEIQLVWTLAKLDLQIKTNPKLAGFRKIVFVFYRPLGILRRSIFE